MCGIVYKHNLTGKPVNNDILQQFDKQRSRGTQGFGLFDGQYLNMVHEANEDQILKWLVNHDSNLIMFHHRFPTSTVNVAKAAHPMSTKKYFGNTQYILVHNGVISNDEELFVQHSELGIEYQTMLDDLTFNDSESLLWEFALVMEGKKERMDIRGDMAFVALKLEKGKLVNMYFGRNSMRPLNLYRAKDTIELSSEGRGDSIKPQTLYSYNYKKNRLTKKAMAFTKPWEYSGNRGSYTPNSGFHDSTYHGSWNPHPYSDNNWDDIEDYGSYPSRNGWEMGPDGIWREKQERKEPNALESILRAKFPKLFEDADVRIIGQKATSEAVTIADVLDEVDQDLMDENFLDDHLTEMEPSSQEIQTKSLDVLNDAEGNFETAYWLLEDEYGMILEDPETMENIRQRLLLESCMAFLESDPEYTSPKSVSSIWRNVCQQQKLLTA